MLCFDQTRHIKSGKCITPMSFAEHLRKSDVSKYGKVYYGRFLRNGLHEDIVILVQLLKVDEIYNTLKSASLFISREMNMELDDQCFC